MGKFAVPIRLSWLTIALLLVLPGSVFGAKGGKAQPTVLNVDIYNDVVDEQDTNAFYGSTTGQFCSGSPAFVQPPAFSGEVAGTGSLTAYGESGSPFPSYSVTSTVYSDGTDPNFNPISAKFDANAKILSLDTRGTLGPRTETVRFDEPCNDCGGLPAGDPTVFNSAPVTEPMLLNISMTSPYTSMAICSSAACTEAEPAFAKLWFADPSDSSTTWRVDWANLRVLRVNATTWYILADACDGTQIAGLSKLIGNRTRPKTVFNGYFKVPFFIRATIKQP